MQKERESQDSGLSIISLFQDMQGVHQHELKTIQKTNKNKTPAKHIQTCQFIFDFGFSAQILSDDLLSYEFVTKTSKNVT